MFKILDGREQFYQWDIDRKLIVEPETDEVHYSNISNDKGLVCKTYKENGVTLADVPNILLQKDLRLYVYAYDKNYTKYSKQFDVVSRAKPESYIYTETETLNYNILLNKIEEVDQNIGQTIEDYLEENPIEVDLTGYATEKYVDDAITAIDIPEVDLSDYYTKDEVDTKIETIELTPGEKGDKGDKGDKGEPGEPGKDGYTPIKGVDYFDGKDGINGEDGYTPVKGVDYFDGINGQDGKDYVLTDTDKQEIADMVDVSADVDMTDYYTKEEIDDLLANLPTGDIPSGEEVKW